MKKFKKGDFKKMVMLGIASGSVLAAQASAGEMNSDNSYSNYLAVNACGGGKCGGMQAYRGSPYQQQQYYNYGNPSYSSCSTPSYSSCQATAPYGAWDSYNNPPSGWTTMQGDMPAQGCASQMPPQGTTQQGAPQGAPQTAPGQTPPSSTTKPTGAPQAYNQDTYTQWDNGGYTSDIDTPSDKTRPSSSYGPPKSPQPYYQSPYYQTQPSQSYRPSTGQPTTPPSGSSYQKPSGGYTADSDRSMSSSSSSSSSGSNNNNNSSKPSSSKNSGTDNTKNTGRTIKW